MKKGTMFTAHYYTSVYKVNMGAWREERVHGLFEAVSEKMAVVIKADTHDTHGSKRQYFRPECINAREEGKRKRISCLRDVNEIENDFYEIEKEYLSGGGIPIVTFYNKEDAIASAENDLWRYDLSSCRINVNRFRYANGEKEYIEEVWNSSEKRS